MSKTDDSRTIFYEAIEKLELKWVDRNSVLHKFTDGKGEIVLEDHVTRINGAFADCTSLTSITIPDSVTEIGEDAFRACSSLASIIIPDSVKIIGINAFMSCDNLKSVVIPDSTVIGYEDNINLDIVEDEED